MGPLMEAIIIFVGIPATSLAVLASVVYGAVAMVNNLRAVEPAPQPARVVAFPGPRPVVVRSAETPAVRRAA